jgi:hypothetical protein
MRPAPSLHYVSTLLDHRRRRYHRARLRWGTGLTLLGLGLLLGGWWGALRLLPRATPRAAVISPAGLPAQPAGTPGMRRIAVAPRWGGPGLLEPEVCQDCAGQTRSPWHPACTPGDVVALGGPTRPRCTPDLAQRPWDLALPARGPLPVQTGGALAAPGAVRAGRRGGRPLLSRLRGRALSNSPRCRTSRVLARSAAAETGAAAAGSWLPEAGTARPTPATRVGLCALLSGRARATHGRARATHGQPLSTRRRPHSSPWHDQGCHCTAAPSSSQAAEVAQCLTFRRASILPGTGSV